MTYPASLKSAGHETKPVPQPAEPHLRQLVALLAVLGGGLFIGVPLATRKPGWLAFSLLSLGICVFIAHRFLKEREIVRNSAVAVGTVTEWRETQGAEGGYEYSVKYYFTVPDGMIFQGKASSTSELPHKGCLIEILYHREAPDRNRPLEAFWFTILNFAG